MRANDGGAAVSVGAGVAVPVGMTHKRRTVEDFMKTAVLTLKASDSIATAREQMRLAEIRHLPVVDEHNRVVGMVSERDLHDAHKTTKRVSEIMHHPVVTVRPSTPAHEAASILIERKIGSLPVIAADEQLVGIVTESDFLAVAREALGGVPATI